MLFRSGKTYWARIYNGSPISGGHSDPVSLDVAPNACPAADTAPPTCQSFGLSLTHGPAGTRPDVNFDILDNTNVAGVYLYRDNGTNNLAVLSNSGKEFIGSWQWDTSGLAPNTYTIIANATDGVNTMEGLKSSPQRCAAPWQKPGPDCSGWPRLLPSAWAAGPSCTTPAAGPDRPGPTAGAFPTATRPPKQRRSGALALPAADSGR